MEEIRKIYVNAEEYEEELREEGRLLGFAEGFVEGYFEGRKLVLLEAIRQLSTVMKAEEISETLELSLTLVRNVLYLHTNSQETHSLNS